MWCFCIRFIDYTQRKYFFGRMKFYSNSNFLNFIDNLIKIKLLQFFEMSQIFPIYN